MKEEFLHYIWQLQLFQPLDLQTSQGEKVTIVHPGTLNTNAGPDFINAKIYISDTLWVGNVEIHTHASEWRKHQHQHDAAYNNVILHVAYIHDSPIFNHLQLEIPSIELRSRIRFETQFTYEKFLEQSHTIPCASAWKSIPNELIHTWLERLLIQRIERKSDDLALQLERNQNHWEQTFYEAIAQQFGFKVNAQPFLQLAQSIPITLLAKHKNNLFQLEALLFGQSGLIPTATSEPYILQLQKEYAHLQQKYQLTPLPTSIWKFARMRPIGFPTVRIAQFAQLIHQSSQLFSHCIQEEKLASVQALLAVQIKTPFWLQHYHFHKPAKTKNKKLGKDAVNSIIINCIIPFLFLYGKHLEQEAYIEKALDWIKAIQPEKNSIINNWKKIGIEIADAGQTQSLIELNSQFCVLKKCLHCAIGNEILKKTNHDSTD